LSKDFSTEKVSVIIPTRHRLRLLQRAINSVCAQDYPNIEIVVFDNFSNEPILAEELISSVPLIVVRSKQMEPLPVSRNRGVEAASGSLLAFLDDDDEFLPGRIGEQVDALAKSPCSVLAYGNTEQRLADGSVIIGSGPPDLHHYLRWRHIQSTAFTIRRDCFENSPFDPRMTTYEDVHFIGRILRNHEATHVDQTHSIWYRDDRPDQLTNSNWRRAYLNWQRLCVEFDHEIGSSKQLRRFYHGKMLLLAARYADFRQVWDSAGRLL
jgi:glycosyltransferase involved in cell wall biosynthesis